MTSLLLGAIVLIRPNFTEFYNPSKPPLKFLLGSIKVQPSRKNLKKMLVNGFILVLKFFYCPLLYPKVC